MNDNDDDRPTFPAPDSDSPEFPKWIDKANAYFAKERVKRRAKEMKPREWPLPEYLVKRWTAHGLDCAIMRGPGSLCGYVRVPEGHPYDGLEYDDLRVEVHGGLTFRWKAKEGGMWFGFDCAHAGDWTGYYSDKEGDSKKPYGYEHPGQIWTAEDVAAETEKLAKQLAHPDTCDKCIENEDKGK